MSNKEIIGDTSNVSLEEKLNAALATITALSEEIKNLKSGNNSTPVYVQAPTDDTRVVYLSDSHGHIEANGVVLECSKYGETFVLSRSQLDALIGKYRHWFDRGILALGNTQHDIKVAAEKGVKTAAEYALTPEKLNKLGSMTAAQIEKLWESCESRDQKLSIVTFYKRNFYEHKDGYRNREKVDCLNRLTNNGFQAEVQILSTGNYKIDATDLLK